MHSTTAPPPKTLLMHMPGEQHRATSRCNPADIRVAWERAHGGVDADAQALELLARLAQHAPAREAVFISGIFDSLAPAGLLNTPNLAHLTEALCADPGRIESLHRELAELASPQQVGRPDGRVFELRLLTQGNFEDQLHGGISQSYTCQARVYGVGVAGGKVDINQQRWATWCRAAEAWVEQRWRAGAPLTEIIRDVAAIRRHIAQVNATENADHFGKFKTSADRHSATDFYGTDSLSIVDTKLWPALKKLAEDCRRQFIFASGDELRSHHEQLKNYVKGFEERKLKFGEHGVDREAIQLLGGFAYDMTDMYPSDEEVAPSCRSASEACCGHVAYPARRN
ncbi:hypothetical protein [Variovorax sp. DT-64]|uniref:hypothetical protein n=1 Tax=Variovorax sp. DT-64 TaxID=3396160 RepID=UPI003F1C0875